MNVTILGKEISATEAIKDYVDKKMERLVKYFGEDFDLHEMSDVIDSKLFGDGIENLIFRDTLGDYLAIAKTDKTILYGGSEFLKSQHAGYTDDEILVPLIVLSDPLFLKKTFPPSIPTPTSTITAWKTFSSDSVSWRVCSISSRRFSIASRSPAVARVISQAERIAL